MLNSSTFSKDFSASIVVFLVALPLCLGVAVASGAEPIAGIISGIVGGIVVGYFSGSKLSVSGPAAGLTSIVAASILELKSYEVFLLCVFLAGIIQIIMGFIKAGVIGDFIPNSVIKGMLAAIGIILILKQIPHFLGYDSDPEGDESFFQPDHENTFTELYSLLNHFEMGAIFIGMVGLSLLLFFEKEKIKTHKILGLLPAPLLAVIFGIIINQILLNTIPGLGLKNDHLVQLPSFSNYSDVFNSIRFPFWGAITNYQVWITAVTIALVASIESLLSLEAVDKIDPDKNISPTNRELIAQGIGNSVSGLIGGLPITSVIVRSSANVNSGAKSKNSTILHGVFLLVSILFLDAFLVLIPKAALASILIFTGYKLAKLELFKDLYKRGIDQFAPFIITLLAIVFSDLLKGISIGILVGVYFIVKSNFKTSVFVIKDKTQYLIRFRKEVSFLNKSNIKQTLAEIQGGSNVIIDPTKADFIDKDIIDLINDFISTSNARNIKVYIEKQKGKDEIFNDLTQHKIES